MASWGDVWNFVGDPAGYITGVNKEGFGGVKKMLFGDPNSIKHAYDQAMQMSQQMGQQTKDFLMGQEGKAQQYFGPIQNMYRSAYGAQGMQAPMIPQSPGGPIQSMYRGAK